MEDLLSRKFIYAVLVVILGFVFVLLNKVTAADWMNFAELMGGIYVIGNVAASTVDAVKSMNQPTTTITTTQTPTQTTTTGEIPTSSIDTTP